jgi:hypothetical protein
MELKEQLWPIVKEYTRQVKELMNANEVHWIGTDDNGSGTLSVLDIDGAYYLGFDEVQTIVNRMEDWLKRYGSREVVAQEIRDWQDWWLSDHSETWKDGNYDVLDVWESRYDRYVSLHPRINLEHWLMGCPREKPEPDDRVRLREKKVKRELLKDLVLEYRASRSIWNIIDNLSSDIKVLEQRIKEEDKRLSAAMKDTDAYKNFEQAIKENGEF